MTDNFCMRCSDHCCIGDYATFITLKDAMRISKSKNIGVDEFCFYGPIYRIKKEQNEMKKTRDHAYFDFSEGYVLQLKGTKDKKCIFFIGNKCSVYDKRPMICRIFPLWFKKTGGKLKLVIEEEDTYCPITKGRSISEICLILGRTEKEMMDTALKFYDEIEEYKEYSLNLKDKKPSEVMNIISLA